MSKLKFLRRLFGSILMVGTFQILLMTILYYHIINAVIGEFKYMIIYPLPIVYTVVGAFLVIVYYFTRPILLFIEADEKGEEFKAGQIFNVQDRLMNLPLFIAALSFPAFSVGGVLAALIINYKMGWPLDTWHYGLFGGIFAGLLAIPQSIYACNWAGSPVLQQTMAHVPPLDVARSAGLRFSLKSKFIVNMLALVLAVSGYCVVLGYSQTDSVLKNMEKMEKLLDPSDAADLVDEIEGAVDPRIRSSRYYQVRMGNLKFFFVILMLFGLVLALLIGVAVTGEITRPLGVLQTTAKQVKDGHYEEPIRIVSNDEFAELGGTFNQMKETIIGQMKAVESILNTLRNGIIRMDETVNLVLSVSAEQSSGATRQASAVQETSSTVEEMAVTARQITEQAKMVDDVASKTLNACHDGQGKLDQAQADFQGIAEQVDAIRDATAMLEDRFRETYRIVELIEKIAEQTELLALNATLEAAGAGAEGRRFSVVAEATRTLAVRATESTKEIRALVEAIQEATLKSTRIAEGGREKVVAGGSAIEGVVDALKTISSFADSTSSAIHEITLSTEHQTSASEQLATAISEVSEVASQVEEGANEIESAIGELRNFAETLRNASINGSPIKGHPREGGAGLHS